VRNNTYRRWEDTAQVVTGLMLTDPPTDLQKRVWQSDSSYLDVASAHISGVQTAVTEYELTSPATWTAAS
jgi:hypothetical protein